MKIEKIKIKNFKCYGEKFEATLNPGVNIIVGNNEAGIVRKKSHAKYLQTYKPVQLRYNSATKGTDPLFQVLNFGESKGLGFDRVIIYPTVEMVSWMKNNSHGLKDQTRSKLYVALTRARYSVGIAHEFKDSEIMDGFSVYE